uniref:Uncharacterized protein n=1 Tax=Bionectria ochroleuca TaxID=29856 RepID=A0A8H7NLQ2_BIOOC
MRAAQMITTVADWVRYFVFAWHGLEDKRENEVGGGGGGGVVQQLESAPPRKRWLAVMRASLVALSLKLFASSVNQR